MSSIRIFADGACRGNPGPGGWGAVILLFKSEVIELGGSAAHTTNNQMEISAIGHALRQIESIEGSVEVFTDSKYVIQGITQWIHAWKKNGFLTKEGQAVANQKYWIRLEELVSKRKDKIIFTHVRGHAGIPGNERVDEIASSFADNQSPQLFRGSFKEYKIDLFKTEQEEDEKISPLYLSFVNGKLDSYLTWEECSQRVHGAAGAKYKKCKSILEVKKILSEWGIEDQWEAFSKNLKTKKGKSK